MANFAQMFGLRAMRVNQGGSKRRRRRRPVEESGDSGDMSMKDMLTLQRQSNKDQFDKEKEFVGKFTDLFFKARESGDLALQRHLKNYAYDYIGALSPQSKALMEPMLRSGPFSPMQQKMDAYDKHNPAPAIDADPATQPLIYAQQLFAREDHAAARQHFATGQTAPKRSLLSFDTANGTYAMRDKEGRVSLVNEEQLQLQDFAKKYDTTLGAVLQNGGAYGKEVKSVVNGVETSYKPFTSVDGKTILEPASGITQAQKNKQDADLSTFMATIASGDEKLISKNPLAALVKKQMDSDETFETVAPLLEKHYPGYSFVKPKQPATIWSELYDLLPFSGNNVKGSDTLMRGGWVEGDAATIKFVPGQRTSLPLSNGKAAAIIYDQANDAVYETVNGMHLGSLEQAKFGLEQRYATLEQRKKKKEEEEDKRSGLLDSVDSYSSGSF